VLSSFAFNFDLRRYNEAHLLFGRGLRAGVDRRVQKKDNSGRGLHSSTPRLNVSTRPLLGSM
jgi:hypothetical protein